MKFRFEVFPINDGSAWMWQMVRPRGRGIRPVVIVTGNCKLTEVECREHAEAFRAAVQAAEIERGR